MDFSGVDIFVFAAYCCLIIGLGLFVSRRKKGHEETSSDYFDGRVRTGLAVFWLLIYVFVNLTSVLYLGALVLKNVLGVDLVWGIAGLAMFSAAYSVYGGLKAVAWTDVVQVTFLIFGGFVTTFLVLREIGAGEGLIAGLGNMLSSAPEKFDMILDKNHKFSTEQFHWERTEGTGICSPDRSHSILAEFHDKQFLDHFYHGYIQNTH